MSLIDGYLIRTILFTTAMVTLVLVSLIGFVNFIGEVGDIGTGRYSLDDALIFVIAGLPQDIYEMAPFSALLGTLLGLGGLAAHGELIAVRAAGVSVGRMVASALVAGIVIMLVAAVLGELIAPPAEQFARRQRLLAMNDQLSLPGGRSAWMKDGNLIINMQQLDSADRLSGISVFELDDDEPKLRVLSRARSARFDPDSKRWALEHVTATVFSETAITTQFEEERTALPNVSPSVMSLSVVNPDALATRALYRYIRYLERNELKADTYEVAFWSRLAIFASIPLMCVLAVPFTLTQARSGGAGQRLLIGALIGIGFYLLTKLMANTGEVFSLDPIVAAWTPAAVLLVFSYFMVQRVR
ncbi:MAG: LPS export ABC transporter permease LptG [Gammaproteobacteria bacterium]